MIYDRKSTLKFVTSITIVIYASSNVVLALVTKIIYNCNMSQHKMLTTIINYDLNTFIVQATVNGSKESLLQRKETGNPYLGEGTREPLLKGQGQCK